MTYRASRTNGEKHLCEALDMGVQFASVSRQLRGVLGQSGGVLQGLRHGQSDLQVRLLALISLYLLRGSPSRSQ